MQCFPLEYNILVQNIPAAYERTSRFGFLLTLRYLFLHFHSNKHPITVPHVMIMLLTFQASQYRVSHGFFSHLLCRIRDYVNPHYIFIKDLFMTFKHGSGYAFVEPFVIIFWVPIPWLMSTGMHVFRFCYLSFLLKLEFKYGGCDASSSPIWSV